MTGLNIDTPHFSEDDRQLIQSYWQKLIADGYELQDENILILHPTSATERIFIVNHDKGYIHHIFKTFIIDRFFNISDKLWSAGMKNFETADILEDMIIRAVDNQIIEKTKDYQFEKVTHQLFSHLSTKGYTIGPFKEMPEIGEEAFFEDEHQHQYTYIVEKRSRKIFLDEATADSKSRSHLTFEELQCFNTQQIMKQLRDKNNSKRTD